MVNPGVPKALAVAVVVAGQAGAGLGPRAHVPHVTVAAPGAKAQQHQEQQREPQGSAFKPRQVHRCSFTVRNYFKKNCVLLQIFFF